jgi:DNA (cytosine-5)-methyltransferase 1
MTTVVSTFSGVGGSSMGYKLAGCKVLASLEFIELARECYRLNFPNTPIIEKDIRNVSGKEILKLIGLKKGELDILDGSPPCASFSVAGKGTKLWGQVKQYSSTKQRTDDLFDEQIRLIDEIRPKACVIENVRGMTIGVAKSLLSNYINKLIKIGYDVNVELLDAKYFETATSRQRVFIIGIRKDLNKKASHPKPFSKPTTFGDAVKNIKIDEIERQYLLKKVNECELGRLPYVKQCKQGETLAKYNPKGNYFSTRRASMNKPLPTITTKFMDLVHPLENRTLTIDELKACSSFTPDFKITGSYMHKYERIGRAVPPNLMKHIANHIIQILKN